MVIRKIVTNTKQVKQTLTKKLKRIKWSEMIEKKYWNASIIVWFFIFD
jgi:hypothetical protein